jgi:hypothetical protein
MAPGVYDEEDKNEKTQYEEYNRPWLLFPQNLETLGDLLEIHASPTYTGWSEY